MKERKEIERFFEHSIDMLCIAGFDGYFKVLNRAWEVTLGWSREELLQKPWIEFVHPDDRKDTEQIRSVIVEGREAFQFENRYLCKDGGIKWLSWNSFPYPEDDVMFGVARDITEERLGKEALQAERDRAEMYLDVAGVMFVAIDRDERVTMINRKGCDILGMEREAVVGQNWFEKFIPANQTEATRKVFHKIIRGEISSVEFYENRIVTSQGEERLMAWHNTLLRDQDGNITGTLSSGEDITERRMTEVALLHSEDLMRYVIEHSNSAIAIHDRDLRYLYVSQRYLDQYRIEERDVIGKHHYEVFPDLPQKWRDVHQRALAGEVSGEDEDPYILEDGGIEWTRWECRPWYESDGSVGGIIVYTEVITRQVEEREALRISESRYSALFNQSLEGIFLHDFEGCIIDANQMACTQHGYSRDELLQMTIFDLHPDPLDSPNPNKDEIIKVWKMWPDDRSNSLEATHRRKEGSTFPVKISSGVIRVNNQRLILAVVQDDTERVRHEKTQQILYSIASYSVVSISLEEVLLLVRNELKSLLDTTNFFVALYDPERDTLQKVVFEDQNDRFTEWPAEGTYSGTVVKMGKTLLMNRSQIEQFARDHNLKIVGSMAQCWLGVPLREENRTIGVMVLQSYTDLNAYDESSTRLVEMIAHEVSMVIHRRNMIVELVAAKEKAEESDRLKSAFLANVSHEIRTPMNGILGFLSLLDEPDLDSDARQKYLDIVNKSGERLLSTINDIIEIAKLESGQLDLFFSEVNLTEVMKFHEDFFRQLAEMRGLVLTIKQQLTGTRAIIKSDRNKLGGVLNNLLSNAIKYTEKGSVEFGNFLDDGMLVFYVKDTGRGIAAEHQRAIFDRFFQSNISITRKNEGSGLGLSIVRAYAEVMGGKTWVESETGKGSTFYFSIPYVPV